MKKVHSYPIRAYSKGELIDAYCGNIYALRTRRRWFRRELETYPGLMDTLLRLGYKKNQRIYTRAQVKAIFDAIGAP